MRLRCPDCQSPIEVVEEFSLTEITCPSCGSHLEFQAENGQVVKASNGAIQTATWTEKTTRMVGHFELVSELGRGAFGSVWKAKDTRLDRTVAIKIPRRDQLDAQETELFYREARAAAQLNHPNIVRVHEVGRSEGTIYIVNDLIEGLSLADWISGQQFTPREAAQLCCTVAEALHYAHERGVIHRDLKPANVLLDRNLSPHVADFGLAKREAGEYTMTVDGQLLGTPAYMSPEQAQGDAHNADRRSDVYSLGVILYELLAGERPFRGNVRMLIHQVISEDAPSLRRLNEKIPKDLETICLRCLEKEPAKRFQTAEALAQELKRFLNGEPILSRPISQAARLWRWCRRNPEMAALSAGLVLTLPLSLVVSGAAFWINDERNAAVAAKNDAVQAKEIAVVAEAEAVVAKEEAIAAKEIEAHLRQAAEKAAEAERLAKMAEQEAKNEAVTAQRLAEERRKLAKGQELLASLNALVAEEQALIARQQEVLAKDAAKKEREATMREANERKLAEAARDEAEEQRQIAKGQEILASLNALVAEEQAIIAEAAAESEQKQRILAEKARNAAITAKQAELEQRAKSQQAIKRAEGFRILAELNEMMAAPNMMGD